MINQNCECAACQQKHKPLAEASEADVKVYESIADNFWKDKRIAELERENAELRKDKSRLIEKNNGANAVTAQWIGKYDEAMLSLGAANCRASELESELESALAKSASREVALVEKLKVAEEALTNVQKLDYFQEHNWLARNVDAALAKIKEAS